MIICASVCVSPLRTSVLRLLLVILPENWCFAFAYGRQGHYSSAHAPNRRVGRFEQDA